MPSEIDQECLYAENHEWIRVDHGEATIGISDYAQEELTDIVYVELPAEGDTFDQGEVFGVVESVKAASDVYLPVAGEIIEVNASLEDAPELVNLDPYGDGWFVRIKIADESQLDALMNPDDYERFVEAEES